MCSAGESSQSCILTLYEILVHVIFQYHFLNILIYLLSLLGPHLWHMEVPRLGVESELQLPAYATATPDPDPSCVFDLHHSSQQRRILNPLSEARNQTRNHMVPSRIRFCCAMVGTPEHHFFKSNSQTH